MDQFNNFWIQLGAIGAIVLGLTWVSRYLFQYVMKTLKDNSEENKKLEIEFRDYLISQAKEHHAIIEKNTEVQNKLLSLLEHRLSKHFEDSVETNKKLIRVMDDLSSTLKNVM